jgi:glycosyltransferase involved in cell wall biosynthesis
MLHHAGAESRETGPAAAASAGLRRIALVGNTGWNIVRFRSVLIEALRERGLEVSAIADFSAAEVEAAVALGARPLALHIDAAGYDPRADLLYLGRLTRLLRRERPDLVHLFTLKPVVYGALAARLAGIRGIVASVTGSGILTSNQGSRLRPLIRGLLRGALTERTRVIFQNEADLAAFTRLGLVNPARTRLIAGSGVDTTKLAPDPDVPAEERRTFVMASRMLWSKGVADFVEAARLVRRRHPEASFSLFGGSREDYGSRNPDFVERAWLDRVNEEGVVIWHGRTEPAEVEAAMRRAAAVVLPSSYGEGVPRSLIEAAAAGAPIITTDMPGCRDTVRPGRSGFLCAPHAPQELAAAMLQLLDDPARIAAMGDEGRRLAVERFDAKRIVDETLLVYAAAVGGVSDGIGLR